eukprot:COSAG01_NODE_5884_length_3971_cov_8.104339_2_plen_405_part_01
MRGYGATVGKLQDSLARTHTAGFDDHRWNMMKRVWNKLAQTFQELQLIYKYAKVLVTAYEALDESVTTKAAGEAEVKIGTDEAEVDAGTERGTASDVDAGTERDTASDVDAGTERDTAYIPCQTLKSNRERSDEKIKEICRDDEKLKEICRDVGNEQRIKKALRSARDACSRQGIQQALEHYQMEYCTHFKTQMQVQRVEPEDEEEGGEDAADGEEDRERGKSTVDTADYRADTKQVIHTKAMQSVLQWLQERTSNAPAMTTATESEAGPETLEFKLVNLTRSWLDKAAQSSKRNELLTECWIETSAVAEIHRRKQRFLKHLSDKRQQWYPTNLSDKEILYLLTDSERRALSKRQGSKAIEFKGPIKDKHWAIIGRDFAQKNANWCCSEKLLHDGDVVEHMEKAA